MKIGKFLSYLGEKRFHIPFFSPSPLLGVIKNINLCRPHHQIPPVPAAEISLQSPLIKVLIDLQLCRPLQ